MTEPNEVATEASEERVRAERDAQERVVELEDDRLRGLKIAHKYTLDTQTVEEACASLVEIITAQRERADRAEAALRATDATLDDSEYNLLLDCADGHQNRYRDNAVATLRTARRLIRAALAAQPAQDPVGMGWVKCPCGEWTPPGTCHCLPAYGPCSACGDGDTAQKHHKHDTGSEGQR